MSRFDPLVTVAGIVTAFPPAARVFDNLPGLPLDPSQKDPNKTSKIIIDATRQLPGEGGPATFPKTNREILTALAPDAFARVDSKWADVIAKSG